MNRALCVLGLTFVLVASHRLPMANAGQITVDSAPFTFAFSAVNAVPNCWALEPTGGNTNFVQDNFWMIPAPTGGMFSGTGPRFIWRTVADGWAGEGCGNSDGFSVPITAGYSGSVPSNATNVQLTLELTKLSIFGAAWNEGSGYTTSLAWNEPGVQTSPAITLKAVPESADMLATSYTQLVWNPTDSAVTYTPGTDVTRTFNLGNAHFNMLEGFEVMGFVHLSYQTVPEPSVFALLIAGMLSLLAYAWRKRK